MAIGYELDKILTEPVEYWAYRCRAGRRISKHGPYATEARARDEIDFQRTMDREDFERSRVETPESASMPGIQAPARSSTTPSTSTDDTASAPRHNRRSPE